MNTTLSTAEIAELTGGTLLGNPDLVISGVGKIETAKVGELSFIGNPKYAHFATTTSASCLLVPKDFPVKDDIKAVCITVEKPYEAFLSVLLRFVPPTHYPAGFRHPSAVIDETALVSDSAYIGAGVVIGAECSIADNVVILPNVTLYTKVSIGEGSRLNANVVCYDNTVIGKRCILHAGAVIGSDGFGYVERADGSYAKIPHIGNVEIGDDVEIGANTTIDRATMGSTIIANGVKLDNLVHIAHNVEIGEDTAMASQTGISGSARIGKRNRFGGQVGMVGHCYTADDVMVVAQSGISKTIPEKGRYFGAPAKDFMMTVREQSAVGQLPEVLKEFRALKKEVEELRKKLG